MAIKKLMYETSHKLSFDLLSHYKDCEAMKDICSSLRSVFSWSDPISKFGTLEEPSLIFDFIKTVLFDDKCEYFFKIMWEGNAAKKVRESIGKTVVRALHKGIKIVSRCRMDEERKELPIVADLNRMIVDVVRRLFAVLKNRQF